MAEAGIDHGTFIPKTNVLPLHHRDDAERGYKHRHILKNPLIACNYRPVSIYEHIRAI